MTADDRGAHAGDGERDDGREARPGATDLAAITNSDDGDRDAIRARLTPASSLGGESPLRVARGAPDGVSTQRHPMVDATPLDAELRPSGGERYVLRAGGRDTRVVIGPPSTTPDGTVREVLVDGFRFEVETVSDRRASLRERATRAGSATAATGPLEVRAVIPGKVVRVAIAVGDAVTAGQQLLVVEAMKMQNELRSPRDGTISRVGIGPGMNIEVGDLLVVIS